MENPFIRLQMALGERALEKLRGSHVAVFGIGGVGSYTAEALARAGVGAITLVDNDTVGVSNLNRQLCAILRYINTVDAFHDFIFLPPLERHAVLFCRIICDNKGHVCCQHRFSC